MKDSPQIAKRVKKRDYLPPHSNLSARAIRLQHASVVDKLNHGKATVGARLTDATMSPLGQSRHFDRAPITSGGPRSTGIFRVSRHVSNLPHPGSCSAAVRVLLEHLVGIDKQGWRNGRSKGLGRLEVDHLLQAGWLLDP